jgi:hypothetical protein
MRHTIGGPAGKPAVALLILATLGLAGCSGSSSPSAGANGGAGASTAAAAGGAPDASAAAGGGAGASTDAGAGAGSGAASVTGSLVSSGLYDATWTWQSDLTADIGTAGTSLKSDKGTFGNISVLPDGSITFTSGAPELKAGSYKGTGAQVHMKDAGGTQLPCGWTLDNDVTGSDGVIHLKGTMDVHGTVWDCPA